MVPPPETKYCSDVRGLEDPLRVAVTSLLYMLLQGRTRGAEAVSRLHAVERTRSAQSERILLLIAGRCKSEE
jgi:hypothetical protein